MTKRKRFAISKELSEGLSQTVMAVQNNAGTLHFEIVPLSKIELDPANPRDLALTLEDVANASIDKSDPLYSLKIKQRDALQSLVHTIQSKGVLNPVWVYKHGERYRLAAGERRVLASWLAGKEDIPAKILEAQPNEFDLRFVQWIENIERQDLTLSEKLDNLRQLIDAHPDLSLATINASALAQLLGCSRVNAHHYCVVLNAPEDIQQAMQQGALKSLEKAAVVGNISEVGLRKQALDMCLQGATLKALRVLAHMNKQETTAPVVGVERRGRQAKKFHLGSTHSVTAVKAIVSALLNDTRFAAYRSEFQQLDWQDFQQVNAAFKRLLRVLEQPAVAKRTRAEVEA